MAKLSYSAYKSLPMGEFAMKKQISEEESKKWSDKNIRRSGGKIYLVRFPVQDKAHQRNALARVAQSSTTGLSSKQKSSIKNTASKKLYGKKDEKKMQGMVTSYKKGYSS